MLTEDMIRQRILRAIGEAPVKTNLKRLSVLLGRNPAYLQQYMKRRSPRILPEDLRHRLAQLLEIDPAEIAPFDATPRGLAPVYFIDHPAHHDHHKKSGEKLGPCSFPRAMLCRYGIDDTANLGMALSGDDTPDRIITRGDWVLVNLADRDAGMAGYFAIDMDKRIRIRHLEQTESLIVSHNGHDGYRALLEKSRILGRVLCHFRIFAGESS